VHLGWGVGALALPPGELVVGKSKVFIRQPRSVQHLEARYLARKEELAAKIQAHWRRVLARRRYLTLRAAAIKAQTHARRALAQRELKRRREAVAAIRKYPPVGKWALAQPSRAVGASLAMYPEYRPPPEGLHHTKRPTERGEWQVSAVCAALVPDDAAREPAQHSAVTKVRLGAPSKGGVWTLVPTKVPLPVCCCRAGGIRRFLHPSPKRMSCCVICTAKTWRENFGALGGVGCRSPPPRGTDRFLGDPVAVGCRLRLSNAEIAQLRLKASASVMCRNRKALYPSTVADPFQDRRVDEGDYAAVMAVILAPVV
jgi:hypothetical protein